MHVLGNLDRSVIAHRKGLKQRALADGARDAELVGNGQGQRNVAFGHRGHRLVRAEVHIGQRCAIRSRHADFLTEHLVQIRDGPIGRHIGQPIAGCDVGPAHHIARLQRGGRHHKLHDLAAIALDRLGSHSVGLLAHVPRIQRAEQHAKHRAGTRKDEPEPLRHRISLPQPPHAVGTGDFYAPQAPGERESPTG